MSPHTHLVLCWDYFPQNWSWTWPYLHISPWPILPNSAPEALYQQNEGIAIINIMCIVVYSKLWMVYYTDSHSWSGSSSRAFSMKLKAAANFSWEPYPSRFLRCALNWAADCVDAMFSTRATPALNMLWTCELVPRVEPIEKVPGCNLVSSTIRSLAHEPLKYVH